MIGFTFVLLIALPIVVAGLLLWYRVVKPWMASARMDIIDQNLNVSVLTRALERLSCKPLCVPEGDDKIMTFDYQSGHFLIRILQSSPYVQLTYPYVFKASVDTLELVRYLCNQINSGSAPERTIYTVDEKDRRVDLHIIAPLLVNAGNAGDQLERSMAGMFEMQRTIVSQYQTYASQTGGERTGDWEKTLSDHLRVVSLIHEQELVRQPVANSWRTSEDKPKLTVRQLLDRVMRATGSVPVSLVVSGVDMESQLFTDAGMIDGYDLESLLIPQGSHQFARTEATGTLTYLEGGEDGPRRRLSLCLAMEEQAESVLYYRVTVTTVPESAGLRSRAGSRATRCSNLSFLVAHDLVSVRQSLDEFRYMWKEAMALEAKGDRAGMTPAQRLISLCTDPDIAGCAYRGERLYLDNRPYEAQPLLYEAYRRWSIRFDSMSDDERQRFFEVCYLLGSCHARLGQYAEAIYYLEFTLPLRNMLFVKQYVNCLVNGGDLRALSVVDGLMKELCEDMPVTDLGERERSLYHFLRRRKATALIYMGKEAEGEKILREMLAEPDNADYAIAELANLQKWRTGSL